MYQSGLANLKTTGVNQRQELKIVYSAEKQSENWQQSRQIMSRQTIVRLLNQKNFNFIH